MRIVYTLFIVISVVMASGCVEMPLLKLSNGSSSLQKWLDNDLAPYLAEELGKHPRFKNEPVILVSLNGSDIQPEIDGLTYSMRDKLMNSLLLEPGVTLPWQPQKQPMQHHRELDSVRCDRLLDASYYIGIEISKDSQSKHRVSLRALDVKAGEWVSGFGKHWSGRLTNNEQRALKQKRRDESLRGLRVLPFNGGHSDLAAAYLANNLTCLLRQQDIDEPVVYVESMQSGQASLDPLLNLIGNNLSRYREVRVTSNKKEAGFFLRGETYEIQPDLHQVWVVLQPKDSGKHLSGMDTATWIKVSPAYGNEEKNQLAKNPFFEDRQARPKPVIAELEMGYSNNPADECMSTRPGVYSKAVCKKLEVSVKQTEDVFVFAHSPKNGLSRLSQGNCVLGRNLYEGTGNLQYQFPARRFDQPDWPTVYAIAVNDPQLAHQFRRHLQQLPDACASDKSLTANSQINPWLDTIDVLISDNSNNATWRARRTP